jgi:hypothetical protein
MRPALAAFALALSCACAGGYTGGNPSPQGPGSHPGSVGGPDAGTDGGSGTDGGPDAGTDAGCTPLSLSAAGVIDGCSNGLAGTASVSIGMDCSVTTSGTTLYSSCNGTAGADDAFSGTCGGFPCTSTSLPGNLVCTPAGMTSCTVTICDGGC